MESQNPTASNNHHHDDDEQEEGGGSRRQPTDFQEECEVCLPKKISMRPAPRAKVSSLDFERVVNEYSIQATRDRFSSLQQTHNNGRSNPTNQKGKGDYDTFGDSGIVLPENNHEVTTEDAPLMQGSSEFRAPPPPPPPPPPPSRKAARKIHRAGYTSRTVVRWFLTLATGLMTGLTAIIIVLCTEFITDWRFELLNRSMASRAKENVESETSQAYFDSSSSLTMTWIFVTYAVFNMALALISTMLCLALAPDAIGSGIPEIKAYLNGVRVKRLRNLHLFAVKIVATIFSVSSGLAVGPEGPLVHAGAILGASLTKLSKGLRFFVPKKRRWRVMEVLSQFSTDIEQRDLVSIGAAAGFAAAFGAPIGGLLFSMEEASSFMDHAMFLKTLAATAVATFCLAILHGNLSDYSVISLGNYETPDDLIFLTRFEEVPLYFVVGIGGGMLGGLFVYCWANMQRIRQALFLRNPRLSPRARMMWQLWEVAVLSLITSALTFYLSTKLDWACRPIPDNYGDGYQYTSRWLVAHQDVSLSSQFHCPPGHVNELAVILFGSRDNAIRNILTDPSQYDPRTLLTVGLLFFPLMTFTLGVSLPSGIFMPTFLIGCSLGGYFGVGLPDGWMLYFGGGQDSDETRPALLEQMAPSTFALLGAAALLAGIQRSTVSLCVILVEGTGQVKVLMPVILTVVVARYIGDWWCTKEGLYETAMEIREYPFLPHKDAKIYDMFRVADIMSAPPLCLGPRERASTIAKLLMASNHHGFPVVGQGRNDQEEEEDDSAQYLGLVRRDQLATLLECNVFMEEDEECVEDSDNEDDDELKNSCRSAGSTPLCSPSWTPNPGVAKSPLMHLAYHIKEDRYDHIDTNKKFQRILQRAHSTAVRLEDTDDDQHAWLASIHETLLEEEEEEQEEEQGEPIAETECDQDDDGTEGQILLDESLPPLSMRSIAKSKRNNNTRCDVVAKTTPYYFINRVMTNDKGQLIVALDRNCARKWVNVAAVMNRGAYTVPEFCPVSKALHLFTALGLRHLIVLGGDGSVVGLLTRVNFLPEYIRERTGYDLSHLT